MIFDRKLCKGCYLRVSFCPNHTIVVSGKLNHNGYRPVAFMKKEGNGCTGCGVCSNICPDFTIRVVGLGKGRELGGYALERMKQMKERHPLIGDVRGIGLFLGIELVKDRATRERASEEAEEVMYRALTKGLTFKLTMGNIITFTPPLIITKEEMDRTLDIIDTCLTEMEEKV